jgi:hypothetical protein
VYQCGEAPETLPPQWSVAIPCAADNTGTGSAVLPGNLAVPLLSLGDRYAIKASDCIQHCARLGYPVAAVEDCKLLRYVCGWGVAYQSCSDYLLLRAQGCCQRSLRRPWTVSESMCYSAIRRPFLVLRWEAPSASVQSISVQTVALPHQPDGRDGYFEYGGQHGVQMLIPARLVYMVPFEWRSPEHCTAQLPEDCELLKRSVHFILHYCGNMMKDCWKAAHHSAPRP